MKRVFILVGMVALAATGSFPADQQACRPAAVRAAVAVAGGEFSLADLLAPSTCPPLLGAAARVHLGKAPLPGSVRVLRGDEVRALFGRIAWSKERSPVAWDLTSVPERITVRRAGARASCVMIGEQILANQPAHSSAARILLPGQIACGAAGRIPEDSPLELSQMRWDPKLNSWETSARCARPADCVPFLVRVHGHDLLAETDRSVPAPAGAVAAPVMAWSTPRRSRWTNQPALAFGSAKPLVRAGETVTLSWDEAGIRLVVPVVCLDPGGMGEKVRVRIVRTGRTVRAVVVNVGQVRAAS